MSCDKADSYSGNYYATHTEVSTTITPLHGDSHLLSVHVQGIERGYLAGFAEGGKLVIYKNNFGVTPLASCDFAWSHGTPYHCTLSAKNGKITLVIDHDTTLAVEDQSYQYGMFGCHKLTIGRTLYGNFAVKGGV